MNENLDTVYSGISWWIKPVGFSKPDRFFNFGNSRNAETKKKWYSGTPERLKRKKNSFPQVRKPSTGSETTFPQLLKPLAESKTAFPQLLKPSTGSETTFQQLLKLSTKSKTTFPQLLKPLK